MIAYNDVVKEHFFAPKNVDAGHLGHVEPASFGSREACEYICVWMDCNGGKITKMTYKVLGNPYLIAMLSITSEALVGKTLEEALHYDYASSIALLDIPKHKRYCVILVWDVVKVLIERWMAGVE